MSQTHTYLHRNLSIGVGQTVLYLMCLFIDFFDYILHIAKYVQHNDCSNTLNIWSIVKPHSDRETVKMVQDKENEMGVERCLRWASFRTMYKPTSSGNLSFREHCFQFSLYMHAQIIKLIHFIGNSLHLQRESTSHQWDKIIYM